MLELGETLGVHISSQSIYERMQSECGICCTVLHVGRVAVALLCCCCCAYVLLSPCTNACAWATAECCYFGLGHCCTEMNGLVQLPLLLLS